VCSVALLLAAPRAARASQDDILVPVPVAEALLTPATGWLTASVGQADLAFYPIEGSGYHRWHGRLRADIAVAQPSVDSVVRLGLAVQTVADDRNDISFRLTRLYYDAFAAYEHRLGPGIGYIGYRHRCSHGADAAVEGRVLIRSGPELGYELSQAFEPFTLHAQASVHTSLIAQNPDLGALPRLLLGAAADLQWRTGWVSWVFGAGFGTALVSSASDYVASLGDPWRDVRVEPLPALAAGAILHGVKLDFRLLVHYQRILDSGIGPTASPTQLFSLQAGFVF
jgi:hypothetical protein